MKMNTTRSFFLTASVLWLTAAAQARVVVLDTAEHAAPFLQSIDAQLSDKLPDLKAGDVVVITHESNLSLDDEKRLEEFVRSGGGLLATHTSLRNSQWMWENWANSPVERVLPAVIVPKGIGIENYFAQTRITESAEHPVTAGIEIGAGPQVPFHVPVVLPTDPRLSRHHLFPVWEDTILKGMTSREWMPILWGSDAERRCLLAVGRYGAGYSAMLGVDYASEDFAEWHSYAALMKNLTAWLGQNEASPNSSDPRVLAIAVDTPAVFSLRRMGYQVLTTPPAEWQELDAVVVGDKVDDEDAAAVTAYLKGGGRVLALSPQALQSEPLRAATGATAMKEPLLSQVWRLPDLRPGTQFVTRRPPRSLFTGSGDSLWEGAPLDHHAFWLGDWGFRHTTVGWFEIPASGATGYALAVFPHRPLLETMKVDGSEPTLVDPPAEFARTHEGWRWLPLDSYAPGRHAITFNDFVPVTGENLLLVDTRRLPPVPEAQAKIDSWRYQTADFTGGAPTRLPALSEGDWSPQPPQPTADQRPPPRLMPLGESPKIEVPTQWKVRQVGDMVSERGLSEKWYAPEFNDADWEQRALTPLRRNVGDKEVPWDQHSGPVWYRAPLKASEAATKSGGLLFFGSNNNFVEVWVNGEKATANPGGTTVPLSRFKTGDNLVAVRVWARPSGTRVPWALEGLTDMHVLQGTLRYRPDRKNLGEAEQWFKQEPKPADEAQSLDMLGPPRVEKNNWFWMELDAPAEASDVRLHFGGPVFLKVWLNGEPVEVREEQTAVRIPGERFKRGRNLIVLRRNNERGMGWPLPLEVTLNPPGEDPAFWAAAQIDIPADAAGVRVSDLTAPGYLYLNDYQPLLLSEGTLKLPKLAAGEQTVSLLLPHGGAPPTLEWVNDEPDRALLTRWQEHTPVADARDGLPAITDGEWKPVHLGAEDKGVLRRFEKREQVWFGCIFALSQAQTGRPALLHFTTPEAISVEPGLVKELWINGKRIEPAERKWAQDFYPLQFTHKTTTFDLTGNLQSGENVILLRPDFSRYKGLDIPVPSDAPWLIPLPELELNSEWMRLHLSGTQLSRVQPPDLYERETFVPEILSGAQPLGEWGDGAPAFLRKKFGAGEMIAATANLNPFLRPRITWSQWGGEQNDMEGGALNANGTYSVVRQDDAQLLAGLLEVFQPRSGPRITGIEAVPGQEQVRVTVANPGEAFEGQLALRVISWESALLKSDSIAVRLPAEESQTLTIEFADAPNYFGTRLKDEYFVRAAVLSTDGAQVLDYLDRVLDATPPVTVNLATDDPIERDLPDAVTRAPQYRKTWAKWEPANEATPTFVYYPGETARLHAAIKNQTAQPRVVAVEIALTAQLSGKSTPLAKQTLSLAPHEQRWLTFEQELSGDFEPYLLQATWREEGSDQPVLSTHKPFALIRPFKNVLDPAHYTHSGGISLHGPGAAAHNTGSFEYPMFDPQTLYGPSSFELDWFELDNLIEAPGNGAGFGVPEIRQNFYWGPFDNGPQSGISALDNSSFLPSGERFWEWMGRLHREAIRARSGDAPTGGMLADFWIMYGMAEAPRNILQFAQWVQVVRGYQPQAKTVSGLQKELKDEFPAEWEQFFNVDAAARNIENMAITRAPGSSMWSQLDWLGPATAMREGHEWAQVAGRWINSGESDNLLRRVHGGERFRTWTSSTARALAPDFALTTSHGNEPGTNNAAFSWQHAQSGVGFLPAENYSRALHNSIWMQTVDGEGNLQPVNNLPMWKNAVDLSLFGGVMGYSTGTLSEWLLFDRAYTLMNVVGMEKPLGAGFVIGTERGQWTPAIIEGAYGIGGGFGGMDSPLLSGNPLRNQWETLRNYGASVPVLVSPQQAANAPVPALIYTMPGDVPEDELRSLRQATEGGRGLVVFFTTGGNKQKETTLSEYFGVELSSNPPASPEYSIAATERAKEVLGPALAGREGKLLTHRAPDAELIGAGYAEPLFIHTRNPEKDLLKLPNNSVGLKVVDEDKQRAVFSSFNGQDNWGSNHDLARAFARAVNWAAGDPIRLPDGLAGHGWQAQGKTFILIEELRGNSGTRELRVKLPAGNYRAVNLIDNQMVGTTYDAATGYLTLKPSLRPLEAMLIVTQD